MTPRLSNHLRLPTGTRQVAVDNDHLKLKHERKMVQF